MSGFRKYPWIENISSFDIINVYNKSDSMCKCSFKLKSVLNINDVTLLIYFSITLYMQFPFPIFHPYIPYLSSNRSADYY